MFEAARRLAFLIREKRKAYTLGQMLRRLLPERFDLLLYEGDAETLAAVPQVEGAPDVEVKRFDAAHLSGFPEIDEKAVGRREVYAVIIDGRVAHRVVLTWDITVPARFGLDAKAPVMDLGFTWPEFRGRRLQPLVRRYVTQDVIARGLYHKVYGGIDYANVASQRGNARAGMRRVARLRGLRVGGLFFRKQVLPWE